MSDNNNSGGSLGLFACVTMIVGGMIGSAIFSLSGLTIFQAGPSAVLTWIIAAVIMLIYGLIVAELATIFPKSGGVFVFPSKALGKTEKEGALWGWISTWGYINANIVAVAFAAIYVSIYLGVGFPVFSNFQIPLAIGSILFCLILNAIKFSTAGKINNILVLGLLIALATYVIISFTSGKWDAEMLTPFFSQGAGGPTGFMGVVPTAMVGYGSIVAIAFMASEVKNPNKNIPKSVLIAMSIVVCVYALIVFSTVGLISAQLLTDNPFMRFIPLFAAASTALTTYPWLAQLISIAAVLALLTTMLVVLALTGRAIKASADKELLPKVFASNSKSGVPLFATSVIAVIAAVVACFPSLTQTIVSFGALFGAVTFTINIISLLQARKKFPQPAGSFKAPGGTILPLIALALLIICYLADILNGGWILWVWTLGWYAVALLIFKVSKASKK